MVAFKNSTGIKANSSFCTFRFPIAEAHQLTKPFQYQAITTALPTQPFAHFVFMPIQAWERLEKASNRQDNSYNTDIETAIADIQLFGTKRQIELAQQFAEEIARNKESSTLELLILLREDLRKELRLEKVPRKFKFLRFSK